MFYEKNDLLLLLKEQIFFLLKIIGSKEYNSEKYTTVEEMYEFNKEKKKMKARAKAEF